MSGDKTIKVGSRKSELALIQTKHVISLLKKYHPLKDFEIVTMTTMGDQILDKPLPKIGEKSLFTKELETALSVGSVDFLVHSLKDLPTSLPDGMAIGAVLTREDPRDCLLLRQDMQKYDLNTLPKDSVIGTSSLRRSAQLSKKYPHLKVESIRGNLNTRLRKLDELDKFHAIILATAGLHRMGWHNRISKVLEADELLYAVGQGALAVECRENDVEMLALLKPLYDVETALNIIAERSFLKTLGGGCSAPVAVKSHLSHLNENKKKIELTGAVWSLDGKEEIIESIDTILDVVFKKNCKECDCNLDNNVNNVIHCPAKCGSKRSNNNDGNESCSEIKKIKLDSTINVDALKNDPHEHCPVQLPVGVDFMGKCPYLEQCGTPRKCPVNGNIEGTDLDKRQCPFMRDYDRLNINSNDVDNTSQNDKSDGDLIKKNDLYSGLVPHPDLSKDVLDGVVQLGAKLANKLISNGALDIMEKAKMIIHDNL